MPWILVPLFIAIREGYFKIPRSKYRIYNIKKKKIRLSIQTFYQRRMTFTIILCSQNNWWTTLYTEKGCRSIPISIHAIRGTKVQFITDWAQRVNGSYSLFYIERLWTLEGSVSYYSAFCRRAERPWLRRAGEGGIDWEEESRRYQWVSLLPRKPWLAYLTPVTDDITCQNCPVTMWDSLQYRAWT